MSIRRASGQTLIGDMVRNVHRWKSYRLAVLADSPVAFWTMDDTDSTMADLSGNGYNGAYTNTPTLGTTALAEGTAVTFDRTASQYATVAHTAALNGSGALTIEMWLKGTDLALAAAQALIDKTGLGSASGQYAVWWANTSGQLELKVLCGTVSASNSAVWSGAEARKALEAGGHLVVTVSGSGSSQTIDIWWNGVRRTNQGSRTITWTSGNTTILNISRSSAAGSYYGGVIDEVALYSSVLSDERILAHYNAARGAAG